jgi:P2-related tail formation protein
MAEPTLESFAQALYDSLEPMQYAEVDTDYALAKYLAGIGAEFQITEDAGRDQGDVPGWANMLDPDLCPSYALGWLAQFAGVMLDPALDDADQRARIKSADGWKRGTVAAMKGAVKAYLTGTQTFAFRERFDVNNPSIDSPYYMDIVTKTSETPNPTAAHAAILSQKPAGIVLTYRQLAGNDYIAVKTNNATYAVAKTNYPQYANMLTGPP